MPMLPLSIPELLAERAAHAPDAVALLAPGRAPLTYGRLWQHVNQVVQTLHAMGLERRDRIALALPNGPEMATAFLSVAAGATCVPLNPASHASELSVYHTHPNVRAVLVPAGLDVPARASAHACGAWVIEVSPLCEAEAGLFALRGESRPGPRLHEFTRADDVALIMSTSGTTSRPKTVPLTHTNICAAAHSIRQTLALTAYDRCLNVLPLFHLHGLIAAVLASLAAGASVVCTPGFTAPQFFAWLEMFYPTWYTAVPTMHQAILARAARHQEIIARCPLRFIRSASAALPTQVLTALERMFHTPVIESYGMTETASQITSNPLPPGQRKVGSVGVAAGPEVAIMDETGTLLPAREIGEVLVRGLNVMQGYEQASQDDPQVFLQGWFMTGDQGFVDADGYLFITGRLKELINRGGEKIAPQEVEAVLLDHAAVAQAVAFAVPDPRLGEDIAAAVVLHPQFAVTARDIRQFVAIRLTDFKVPRQVLFVDDLPKNAVGKLQRLGLAEQFGLTGSRPAQARPSVGFVAPRTPLEQRLVALWGQVLDLERVGLHDDFFQLGGDSILAGQLVVRIREALHVEVPLLVFFEGPTVACVARHIESMRLDTPPWQEPSLRPVPRQGALPLSYGQQRLWFLEQLGGSGQAYTLLDVVHVGGPVHTAALQRSLETITRRHEVLRTTFHSLDGQPYQVIQPAVTLPLAVVDLSGLSESAREARVHALARSAAERPFDLVQGPLLRAMLVRLAAEEHVLILTMHHIVSDGWSHGVFWKELALLYTAGVTGRHAPLPELPIQYADFAVWQRQWCRDEYLKQQLAYWKQQLEGYSGVLALPTDHVRPGVRTPRGAYHAFLLPGALTEALKALSRQEGVTLFMTLLAAFKTFLYRYTGQADILVGSPVAGRNRVETENLIGFFVNTLLLRTVLTGSRTFRALLGQVREVCLGAYAHQDIPLEKVVEELRPTHQRGQAPILQILFALQNIPSPIMKLPGLEITPLNLHNGTTKCDLTLIFEETLEGLQGWCEYSTDLFETSTITRMLGHFQTLLASIVAYADQAIATLPLLTEAERQQMLVAWNTTQTAYPRNSCIPDLCEAQVERTPEAVAVVCGEAQITYRELHRCTNQLAHVLRELGVVPGVLVGLCLERSIDMVVGMLGILKAGGTYVPLDPAAPPERLAFMLAETQAPVLVTELLWLAKLPALPATVVCLDRDQAKIAGACADNLCSGTTAESLAYVLYTSGSTGEPKGVAVSHRGILRLVCQTNYIRFDSADVVAQVANSAFDAATFEIWGALLHGARLVVLPMDVILSPHAFATELAQQGITVLFLTTALLNLIAQEAPTAFSTIRTLLFGGEVAEPRWVAVVRQYGPPGCLLHVYGPTETTTFASWYLVEDVAPDATTIPIGWPLANTQLYVLDAHQQPVPIGVPGELYIGGDGVAQGYYNRPELTVERFIPDPFSHVPGARLYKTGDLARYRPDGTLEFLRRMDHQVKLRGFRVELGEIEAVLGQHPSVREVVVLAREDSPGHKRLVAYVVPEQSPPPGVDILCSFLLAQLPDYMVPAAWVWLEALPLTPNGKVDRQTLPTPNSTRPAPERTYVAPRDRLEYQLAETWEQVLGVQPIGVHDNFFGLGGHSLLAARLCARLEKVCRTTVPLARLFQAPTVAQLAALLRQVGWPAPPSRLLAYRPSGSKPPFFCVHGVELLSRYVDVEQPWYALHPYALDGRCAPRTIVAMAADYLQEIRTIQAEGPYFLGGGSVGGMIAFEMAHQLQQQGQEVALLVLLDPTSPRSGPAARGHLMQRLKRIGKQMARRVAEWYLASGCRVPPVLRMPYFLDVSQRAADDYVPQVYPGRVTLFRVAQGVGDPAAAWRRFAAGGLEVYDVPGDHTALFREPHIHVLAQQLTAVLSRAQGQDRSASG